MIDLNDPELLKSCEMIIAKIAWTQHRNTGFEVSEMISVGHNALMKAAGSYDPDYGAEFTTWLHIVATTDIRNWISSEFKKGVGYRQDDGDAKEIADVDIRFRSIYFKEWLEDLPSDTKFIIKLVLDRPDALGITGGEPPKKIRGAIIAYLKKIGWSQSKRWGALSVVKLAVKEL